MEKQPRECRLCIRMTKDEYLKFLKKSKSSGMYQAEYIMHLIDMHDEEFRLRKECEELKTRMFALTKAIDEME